jgi:hypothetical protein
MPGCARRVTGDDSIGVFIEKGSSGEPSRGTAGNARMPAAKRKSRLHRKALRHRPGDRGQEEGEAPEITIAPLSRERKRTFSAFERLREPIGDRLSGVAPVPVEHHRMSAVRHDDGARAVIDRGQPHIGDGHELVLLAADHK